MTEAYLKVLGAALSIWESKEKTKYIDKLVSLKKDYYEEINKPRDQQSDAVLDNLKFELQLVGTAYAASVGAKNS